MQKRLSDCQTKNVISNVIQWITPNKFWIVQCMHIKVKQETANIETQPLFSLFQTVSQIQ